MKLAVIGSGLIVKMALECLEKIDNIEVKAICVREKSRSKGEELSKKHKIPLVYTSYEKCLEDSGIDTVYIGIVNNMHFEYAKKALLANKHVILEKPFVDTLEQALELRDIALNHKLYLWEAITTLYYSEFITLQSLVQRLGKIHLIDANFVQYSSRYDRYLKGEITPVFDPTFNGGALRDLNIYNIHFIVALLGLPASTTYFANKGYNGVDTSGVAVLSYDGTKAVAVGSKDSRGLSRAIIYGENGYLSYDNGTSSPSAISGIIDGETINLKSDRERNRMMDEFIAFEKMYSKKDDKQMTRYLNHTIDVMKVIDSIRVM